MTASPELEECIHCRGTGYTSEFLPEVAPQPSATPWPVAAPPAEPAKPATPLGCLVGFAVVAVIILIPAFAGWGRQSAQQEISSTISPTAPTPQVPTGPPAVVMTPNIQMREDYVVPPTLDKLSILTLKVTSSERDIFSDFSAIDDEHKADLSKVIGEIEAHRDDAASSVVVQIIPPQVDAVGNDLDQKTIITLPVKSEEEWQSALSTIEAAKRQSNANTRTGH